MEYQHYGSRGATTTDKKEVDESCTVGTVLVSERRKPVVTNNEGCATATLTTFPSTSPGTTAVPRSPLLVNTVGSNQTEAVAAPATPATPVEPSSLEHTVVDTSPSDTLSATGRCESTRVAPATPATQITNLLSEVGTTPPRSAVMDMVTPAVLTATPATLAATPTVEIAVAAPATPETLAATIQNHCAIAETTVADTVTTATAMPATLSPATQPASLTNIIAQLQATGNLDMRQRENLAAAEEESLEENNQMEEGEETRSLLEHPEEWELIPTDQWDEPKLEFDEPSEDNVPRPEPVELDQDDRSENGQTSEWENEPLATTSATSSVPGPGTSAPEEPSDDEDEQFVDALTLPPQEQCTVPLPIKEEPSNDDQNLSSNDVTEEVSPTIQEHQQLEQAAGMEGDPPFDEAVQQIFDTFQEETEANATIPEDTVTTPEPCNAPQNTLAGIVNCIRYAGRADMHMTRAANSHAAVVAMMRLARWIPQYQRIAQERDVLLEQREQWRTERDEILREQAADRREIQELRRTLGLETTEPLAARIVVSLPATNVNPPMTPSTSSQSQPSERGPGDAGGTVIARRSPVASTSRARSTTPSPVPRRSPTRPISPFRELPLQQRRGSRIPLPPSSQSDSGEERPLLPTPVREPQVAIEVGTHSPRSIPKIVLKRYQPSQAKQHKKKRARTRIEERGRKDWERNEKTRGKTERLRKEEGSGITLTTGIGSLAHHSAGRGLPPVGFEGATKRGGERI
ncbi:hypothetical protein GE061_007863 [Apolygus lucorum]|uniref:Uncharacterized protein n=1 Tax=Apolygus lucorum TaxID=248454 RepID=A0A8S9WQN2_APOLU|nr:hypothetical protein GE061_007863 [Apolygus lucorum]